MAKRRKLELPNPADLDQFEAEFRRETTPRSGLGAPIAQVAADSAGAYDPRTDTDRISAARDGADAERLRAAEARGLLLLDLPLDDIAADAIIRDRTALDPEEMEELVRSIAANGLRMPVEVFAMPEGTPGPRYGLLSGYRRLRAVRQLRADRGAGGHDTIRAILRDPGQMGGAFAAMVEENEVRASLSHFERGRIAVISAQQGAFAGTEAAVDGLFPVASKAKRSKIRSFALIFEELGDMLRFPEKLREKDGLRLAAALRQGGEQPLRAALDAHVSESPDEEWARLEQVLRSLDDAPGPAARGGRPPKPKADWQGPDTLRLAGGVTLTRERSGEDVLVRFAGRGVTPELVEAAMKAFQAALTKG